MGSTRFMVVAVALAAFAALSGCSKQPSGTIRVGAILPLTGPAAPYGESGKRGIDVAFDNFKAQNPDLARRIQLVVEDDQADPKQGVSAYRKLTSVEHVDAIIGPMVSGVTQAIVPLIRQDRILVVSPTSTAPSLRGAAPTFYRTCVSDDAEGKRMALFAVQKLKTPSVAVLHINNEYGLGLAKVFSSEYRKLGGKVVFEDAYPGDATDFRDVATKVVQAGPSAVYLVGQKEQSRLIPQIKEAGFRGILLGTTMFEDPELLATGAAEGAYYTFREISNDATKGKAHPFFAEYKKRYGKDADFYAASNYDSATVVLEAIKASQPSLGDKLTTAPKSLRLEPGATGPLSFDSRNDVAQDFSVKTIRNGKFQAFDRR